MTAEPPMTPEPTRVPGASVRPTRAASARRWLRAASHPAIAALTAAGVLSVLSDTRVVDGLVLVAVALVLVWDSARPSPVPSSAGQIPTSAGGRTATRLLLTRTPTRTATAGIVALSVLVGAFERYSWPVTVIVWALACLALVVSWPPPRSEPAPVPGRGAVAWLAWAVLAGVWELIALLGQPTLMTGSSSHPTISVLLDPVLATYPGRVVVFAVWLAVGWHLCRRAAR